VKSTTSIKAFLDREFVMWGLVPCGLAIFVVGLFAVPNYLRAQSMTNDAQLLKAKTDETIIAQNNLRNLQRMVAALREERDRRCRPLSDGDERDRLLSAITRPTDGTIVREQSIRTGPVTMAEGMPENFAVMKRDVTVEMSGAFDSIFGVLNSAESVDQLVTPRSLEISIMAGAIEQAQTGTGTVRAHIVFEEWFQPESVRAGSSAAPNAPTQHKSGGTR
jgi:hypothetical protein